MLILAMPRAASRDKKHTFEEVFREYYRPVFGIFAKNGCFREECEDLTSETFLRAYRSFDDFRGDAKLFTWLHSIATNLWRNRLRDAAAAKRDGVEIPIPGDGRDDPASEDQPHERAIRDERRRLLRSAITELPPGMRRCVWLRVYQDRNYREIAELLEVTESTAKSQVSLARGRLRSLLAEHYPELDDDLGD